MENQISRNFKIAEEEVSIIQNFYLKKNSKIQEVIDGMSRFLEEYIREKNRIDSNVKTISLPAGTLKLRKQLDKVDVTELEEFLKSATEEMLTIVPESVKPNLVKIKTLMKYSGKSISGVTKIELLYDEAI